MPQLLQRLGFYLAYALPGDPELLSNLLQGVRDTVPESETQLKHPRLTLAEGGQHIGNLLPEQTCMMRPPR